MAKTKEKQGATLAVTAHVWTPDGLVAALKAVRKTGDRVAALKRSGILTQEGDLAKKYKKWGKKVTRTPAAKQLADQ
jgi:hypothetical protein